MQTLQYVVLTDGTHLGPGLAWPQHGKSSGELEMPHCVHCNARKIWSLYRYISYRTAPVLCCVHPNHTSLGEEVKIDMRMKLPVYIGGPYVVAGRPFHGGIPQQVWVCREERPWELQGSQAWIVEEVARILGIVDAPPPAAVYYNTIWNNNDMVRVCVFVCVCVAGMYGESVVYIFTIPISSCSIIYEGNLLTSTTIERDTVYVQQSCNAVLLYTQAKRVGRHSTRDVYQTSTIKFPIKPPTSMYAVLLINAEHHYAYIKYEQIYTTNSYEIPFRIHQM